MSERFTIEVDRVKLFEAVREFGQDAIGSRLLQLCLDGGETGFKNALGLAVYGISFEDASDGRRSEPVGRE